MSSKTRQPIRATGKVSNQGKLTNLLVVTNPNRGSPTADALHKSGFGESPGNGNITEDNCSRH